MPARTRGILAAAAVEDGLTTHADLTSEGGVWTWFTDPRAVEHNGKLYSGFVDALGDLYACSLEAATGVYEQTLLVDANQTDDHDNPSVWVRPDGRIVYFYCEHNDSVMRYRVTTNPESITTLAAEVSNTIVNTAGGNGFSYSNPCYLADEDRIYLFFRGGSFLPGITYSDDDGATWAVTKDLLSVPGERPYVKYVSDGESRIHFFASAKHPSGAWQAGHMYHWYYDATDATFRKSDGTLAATLAAIMAGTPLVAADVTLVHDAATENSGGVGNAWPWSIEIDATGLPVATYSVFVANNDNRYRYARWTGSAWVKHELLAGVGTIHTSGGQPMYVGGVMVDPRDTDRVFLSREVGGEWEIEQWTTSDGGASWAIRELTSGSVEKNFRPYVVRDREDGPLLLWCYGAYDAYSASPFLTEIRGAPEFPRVLPPFTPASISGLGAWYKADALAQADNTAVASWTDSSGNGRHATQATGSKQPTLQTNELNGLPVVRFAGTDDCLTATGYQPGNEVASGLSVFAVVKQSSAAGAAAVASMRGFGAGWSQRIAIGGASWLYFHVGKTPNLSDTVNTLNAWGLLEVIRASVSSIALGHDGTMQVPAVVSGYVPTAEPGLNIGAEDNTSGGPNSAFLVGDIAEIIIYEKALDADERNAVEAYIAAKYALTIA